MKVYLAGAINKRTYYECKEWRQKVGGILKNAGHIVLDPLRRNYRGKEKIAFREIVEKDKQDIDDSDVLLVYWNKPSTGTSMEILYAWERNKTVIVVCKETDPSPWLVYHSSKIFDNFEKAIAEIECLTKGF